MLDSPEIQLDSHSVLITQFGSFEMQGYLCSDNGTFIIALKKGDLNEAKSPLVRIHSKCFTGEVFNSLQCDCSEQLHYSMERIQLEQCGLIIYLNQEARGNGLRAKLKIYQVIEERQVTSAEACGILGYGIDIRRYETAVALLRRFEISKLRLLTNNPSKIAALVAYGFTVQREKIIIPPNKHNLSYLKHKQEDMGHILEIRDES